jgi:hypothetical protein
MPLQWFDPMGVEELREKIRKWKEMQDEKGNRIIDECELDNL